MQHYNKSAEFHRQRAARWRALLYLAAGFLVVSAVWSFVSPVTLVAAIVAALVVLVAVVAALRLMHHNTRANEIPEVDPVVAAVDRRIMKRGLKEFKGNIDHMRADSSWAPRPIDLDQAGVPAEDQEADLFIPEDLKGQHWPDGGEIR
ncbi:hypothetical protein HYX70_03695 [Candidatus Saccharibacteria bacterium]|nr:hypothetical protein [Candidatus Saccharibacteria bacterium]